MGLVNIFIFSAISGISFGLAFSGIVGFGPSFLVLNFFPDTLDSNIQVLITIVSSALTVLFVYRLARFFIQVFEHKLVGVITAILGFMGSLALILAPSDYNHSLVLGISIWIVGIVIVIFYKKKS